MLRQNSYDNLTHDPFHSTSGKSGKNQGNPRRIGDATKYNSVSRESNENIVVNLTSKSPNDDECINVEHNFRDLNFQRSIEFEGFTSIFTPEKHRPPQNKSSSPKNLLSRAEKTQHREDITASTEYNTPNRAVGLLDVDRHNADGSLLATSSERKAIKSVNPSHDNTLDGIAHENSFRIKPVDKTLRHNVSAKYSSKSFANIEVKERPASKGPSSEFNKSKPPVDTTSSSVQVRKVNKLPVILIGRNQQKDKSSTFSANKSNTKIRNLESSLEKLNLPKVSGNQTKETSPRRTKKTTDNFLNQKIDNFDIKAHHNPQVSSNMSEELFQSESQRSSFTDHERLRGQGKKNQKDELLPFLKEDQYTDMILLVEGKKLFIHRCILGYCSEYFQNLFDTAIKVPDKKMEVKITEHSYQDMVELLSYLHPSISKELTEKSAIRLLPMANAFDISALKVKCERLLIANLKKASTTPKATKGPISLNNKKENTPDILLKCLQSADTGASKPLMEECIRMFSNPDIPIKDLKSSLDVSDEVKARIYLNRMENASTKMAQLQNELEKEKQQRAQLQKQMQGRSNFSKGRDGRMPESSSDNSPDVKNHRLPLSFKTQHNRHHNSHHVHNK